MLFEDQYFMVKERNDNKDGQRGGLYQALVSLKYALEYIDKPFCKLMLEHKGDVTFDTYQQIEVKHHAPKCSLGDYHVDFWNTLFNWCMQDDIYKKLILHTTAYFPKTLSLLKSWNKQSCENRYNTIKSIISSNKAKGVCEYMDFIDKMDQDKLKSIISKVEIKPDQPIDSDLILQIANNPAFQVIPCKPEDRKELIRDRVAGFIQGKVAGEGRWEITWYQLMNTIQEISRNFSRDFYNPIFEKYFNKDINENDYQDYREKKFVTELTQISCEEVEIREAINDYWKTSTLLVEEIENNPTFGDYQFQPYKKNKVYPLLTNSKRLCADEKPNNSRYFYRKAKDLNVGSFNSIPDFPYFKHGTMQIIVEDDNLKFSWLYD